MHKIQTALGGAQGGNLDASPAEQCLDLSMLPVPVIAKMSHESYVHNARICSIPAHRSTLVLVLKPGAALANYWRDHKRHCYYRSASFSPDELGMASSSGLQDEFCSIWRSMLARDQIRITHGDLRMCSHVRTLSSALPTAIRALYHVVIGTAQSCCNAAQCTTSHLQHVQAPSKCKTNLDGSGRYVQHVAYVDNKG